MKVIRIAFIALLGGSAASQAAEFSYQIISVRAAMTGLETVTATVFVGNSAGGAYRCTFHFYPEGTPENAICLNAGVSGAADNDVNTFLGSAGKNKNESMPWDNFAMLDVTAKTVTFCFDNAEIGLDKPNEHCNHAELPKEPPRP